MHTSSVMSPTKEEEGESFENFVLFGFIMMVSITAFVAGVVFIVQKLKAVTKSCCKNQNCNQLETSMEFDLQPLNRKPTGALEFDLQPLNHKTTDEVIKTSYMKRENSALSTVSAANGFIKKTTSVREFPHVVSMALLRDDSEMVCILLVPIPYDDYTRDVTDLLKTVFTIEGDIPTQCVFDETVYGECNKNRLTWLDNVFTDDKRIVMFLCFKSMKGRQPEKTIAEEMIKHFEMDKVKPDCHCVFLDVTNNMDELDGHYHGLNFHVKHDKAYEHLISHVVELTGKNVEEDRTLLDKMLKCEASNKFLSVIGHR